MTSIVRFAGILQRFPITDHIILENSLNEFTREDLYILSKFIRNKYRKKCLIKILFSASIAGYGKITELLLLAGIPFERKNKKWYNLWTFPLLEACKSGFSRIVYILLRYGADPNQKTEFLSKTALCESSAQENYDIRIISYLLDFGAEIDTQSMGDTALLMAIYNKNWNVAKYLIDRGADVTTNSNLGGYILNNILYVYPDKDFIQKLLEHGASIKSKDEYGCTPLSICQKNCSNLLPFLKLHRGLYLQGVLDILEKYMIKDLSNIVIEYIL